jgi:hypothetical protein
VFIVLCHKISRQDSGENELFSGGLSLFISICFELCNIVRRVSLGSRSETRINN